jgi:hypothetical protein
VPTGATLATNARLGRRRRAAGLSPAGAAEMEKERARWLSVLWI